jgi:DNA invertase Pin-like site-specific DNA recombinase
MHIKDQPKDGRTSGYDVGIAEKICERLVNGESLRAICADPAMPAKATVFRWLASNQEFHRSYALARECQAEDFAYEILEIGDESSRDYVKKTGVDGRIFAEKISGAVTERKALAKAIAELGPGDVLLVTRLDRLARSTRDLLNVLDAVGKAGAGFRSLADAWADTTTPHGRLMLTVLGGLAEFERELIKARTGEGRTRAQARGVKFGRKPKLTRHQMLEAIARRETGEALTEIGRTYNVSHSTISRL